MTAIPLDSGKFEGLYREFHPRVLAICRRKLESLEEAEDAANDVFARLPAALRTYDSSQPLSGWLSTVASNYCVDLLRKRRSEQRLLEPVNPEAPEPAAPMHSPIDELLAEEASEAVRDAIFSLPERYLVPLVMRYFSELSYDEIAQTLGTSRTHVAVLIFRAKQQLRRILAGGGAREKRTNDQRRFSGRQRDGWGVAPIFGMLW
ncbi:MAG TPA: sigma-70 family RNA polymerase sigma factor [Terriglobia bacterium]